MKATEHENAPAARGKRVWLIWAAALLLAALALVGGFTLAWLYNGLDIQTLLPLEPPSNIALYEPEKDTSLGPISVGGAAGSDPVKLYKVFRVKASGNYKLEIAHTTNLQGLQFKIYKAAKTKESDKQNSYTENGVTYYYDSTPIEASNTDNDGYINGTGAEQYNNPQKKDTYGKANDTYQSYNYGKYGTDGTTKGKVQTHANALYWLGSEMYPGEKDNANANHNDLYICEITWTETANKETDLFYIMARLPQVTTSQGGSSGV